MMSKEEFRERVLADQRRRKELEKQRRMEWYGYQSERGSRMRGGAFRGPRPRIPGGARR